jgi:hypothetical protein
MSTRAVIAVGVLALWVVLGPLGMVFTTCVEMVLMCESPCGVAVSATFAPTLSSTPALVSALSATIENHLPLNALAGLEPPPKSLPRSA